MMATFVFPGEPVPKAQSDIERAMEIWRFLTGGKSDEFNYVVMRGEPKSKARPRRRHGGGFYSPSGADQGRITMELRATRKPLLDGNVAIGCVFFRSNHHRIDADNMTKLVMDGATGTIWRDDSQVTAQASFVELDKENPRTLVVWGSHDSTLDRLPPRATCETCGKTFPFRRGFTRPKFCSAQCRRATGASKLIETKCAACGETFTRRQKAQRFCSKGCVNRGRTNPRRRKYPVPHCVECGKVLSKPGYARCQDCWRAYQHANHIGRGGVSFK